MNEIINRPGDIIAAEINFIKRRTQETAFSAAVEIGRLLCEAKVGVPYGDWGKWLEENVDYSVSNANNLMKLYNEYGDKPQQSLFADNSQEIFAMLSPSQALVLTALPKEERKEFVETHEMESISVRDLQKEVDRLKAEKETAEKSAKNEKADLQKKLKESDIERRKNAAAVKELTASQTEADKRYRDLKIELEDVQSQKDKLADELADLKAHPVVVEQVSVDQGAVDADAIRKEVEEEYTDRLRVAEEQKQALQKKLTAASSATLQKFNVHFGLWQEEYQTLVNLIGEIEAESPEQAEKLRGGMKTIAERMVGE